MSNVTTNILHGALQRVKSELDLKANSSTITEINTALAAKANSADIVSMTTADGDALFDEIFSDYIWISTPSANGVSY